MNAYFEYLQNSLIQAQRRGDTAEAAEIQARIDAIVDRILNDFVTEMFDDEDGTIP